MQFSNAVGPIEDRYREVADQAPDSEELLEADQAGDEATLVKLMAAWEVSHYQLGTLWEEYADAVAKLRPPPELAADVERIVNASREAARANFAIARLDSSARPQALVDASSAVDRLFRNPCLE